MARFGTPSAVSRSGTAATTRRSCRTPPRRRGGSLTAARQAARACRLLPRSPPFELPAASCGSILEVRVWLLVWLWLVVIERLVRAGVLYLCACSGGTMADHNSSSDADEEKAAPAALPGSSMLRRVVCSSSCVVHCVFAQARSARPRVRLPTPPNPTRSACGAQRLARRPCNWRIELLLLIAVCECEWQSALKRSARLYTLARIRQRIDLGHRATLITSRQIDSVTVLDAGARFTCT